jgi:secreted Zn-dependent insulinase-like peptidase
MRLVVIGGYSLDYLQKHVVKSFSDVRSTAGLTPSWDQVHVSPLKDIGMPFSKEWVGNKIWYIAPVKDRHSLSVTWQIPSQFQNWKTKPCDYLAHLMGHEAKGSLLASLKAKSWATACCAGVGAEGYEVRYVELRDNEGLSLNENTIILTQLISFLDRIVRHMLSLPCRLLYRSKVLRIGQRLSPNCINM